MEERGYSKVYLFLFTIAYCLVTNVPIVNIGPGPALGIYLIVLALIKGYCSEELKDVFNLGNTKNLFQKIKLKDSLTELFCLILIYINAFFMDNEPVSLFEVIVLFVGFVLVYRYIFWGTTRTIREKIVKKYA